MLTYVSVGLIFFLAGSLQGMTGFGSALVAMPLLCFFLDVKTAVPLCTLNSIVITTFLVFKLKKHIDRKKILPLCISALPGTVVGVTLLQKMDAQVFKILLGSLLLAYSIYSLAFSPAPRKIQPFWTYIAGFFSGAIGSAFSAGGPPAIMFATLNDWNKDEVKATLTGFFAFNSLISATVHFFTGLTTSSVLHNFLISCPLVLVGTVTGSHFYSLIPHRLYLKITFGFLIIMGCTMVITS
jgi:uncharacterized protein